jgi:uncharacterized protein (DUF305 family)
MSPETGRLDWHSSEDIVNGFRLGWRAATTAAATVLVGCSSAPQGAPAGAPAGAPRVLSQAELRNAKPPAAARASRADVEFFQGMIPHHAQAVLIAGWAGSHGARDDVRVLCERIVVGQRDEIGLMQYWLRSHGEEVPDAQATKMRMKMNGVMMDMLMPGMLNDEQLAELDKARGSDWDRLFLKAMIAHHQGAVSMVDELLNSHDPANDDLVYKMASDVYADQTTEIERMTKMLQTVPGGKEP